MGKEKVTVYCGDGKGKTAAALGCALQAAGQGGSVIIIQFLKGRKEEELEFLRRLEPEVKFFSFTKSEKNYEDLSREEQREQAINIRNGFNFARKVLVTGECSLLILDGFLGLWENRMVSEEDINALMDAASEDTKIIFTGRVLDGSLRKYVGKIYKIYEEQC